MSTDWFVNGSTGYVADDFHLVKATRLRTWLEGDPEVDIDGEPRPSTKNASDVAGADVPTP